MKAAVEYRVIYANNGVSCPMYDREVVNGFARYVMPILGAIAIVTIRYKPGHEKEIGVAINEPEKASV